MKGSPTNESVRKGASGVVHRHTLPLAILLLTNCLLPAIAQQAPAVAPAATIPAITTDAPTTTKENLSLYSFDTPVDLSDTDGAATGGYSLAQFKGRKIEFWRSGIGARIQDRYGTWIGRESYFARGRDHGNRFSGASTFFGGWAILQERERGTLVGQYDGYRGDIGSATAYGTDSISYADFPGPAMDMATLRYMVPTTSPRLKALQNYRINTNINWVRGEEDRSSFALGFGGGAGFQFSRSLTGSVDATGFLEHAQGLLHESGTSFKTHVVAGVSYQPAAWVKLQSSLDLFPHGMPIGGTSLSGLSNYLLYEPGQVVTGLKADGFALLNLRLVLGTSW
ncbi:MAG TPA: hypothetical protein VHR86_00075 [Armatimonadota bacterium]|nr:hypothetical protein [Armatimonadota bacterium]